MTGASLPAIVPLNRTLNRRTVLPSPTRKAGAEAGRVHCSNARYLMVRAAPLPETTKRLVREGESSHFIVAAAICPFLNSAGPCTCIVPTTVVVLSSKQPRSPSIEKLPLVFEENGQMRVVHTVALSLVFRSAKSVGAPAVVFPAGQEFGQP